MLFKKREQEEEGGIIGEAKVVDPKETARETRGASIDGIAEETEVITAQAVIGQSICIKGDVSGDEDLLIEGRVEGTVSLMKSRSTVGSNGHVMATVNAKSLNIEGSMEGDVNAGENVVLSSSGKMQGNIKAPRIRLEDGCKFKGTIDMEMDPKPVVTDLKQPHSNAQQKQNQNQNQNQDQHAS